MSTCDEKCGRGERVLYEFVSGMGEGREGNDGVELGGGREESSSLSFDIIKDLTFVAVPLV